MRRPSAQSAAQAAVGRALREGRLAVPTTCEACGSSGRSSDHAGRPLRGIHLHHWSYAPEHHEDVIPLCTTCHRRVHHGRIPEPRTGRIYQSPTAGPRSPEAVWMTCQSYRSRPRCVRQVEYDICIATDRESAIAQIRALRESEAAARRSPQTFGDLVRDARVARGLTLQGVARSMGRASHSRLSRIEHSRCRPTAREVRGLVRALGLDPVAALDLAATVQPVTAESSPTEAA